jgi:hypothetical protein
MLDAGLIVLAAFISPFRAERRMVREMLPRGRVRRDLRRHAARRSRAARPKGLYAKARAGSISQFHRHRLALRGARAPEIRIDTALLGADGGGDPAVEIVVPAAPAGYEGVGRGRVAGSWMASTSRSRSRTASWIAAIVDRQLRGAGRSAARRGRGTSSTASAASCCRAARGAAGRSAACAGCRWHRCERSWSAV